MSCPHNFYVQRPVWRECLECGALFVAPQERDDGWGDVMEWAKMDAEEAAQ